MGEGRGAPRRRILEARLLDRRGRSGRAELIFWVRPEADRWLAALGRELREHLEAAGIGSCARIREERPGGEAISLVSMEMFARGEPDRRERLAALRGALEAFARSREILGAKAQACAEEESLEAEFPAWTQEGSYALEREALEAFRAEEEAREIGRASRGAGAPGKPARGI